MESISIYHWDFGRLPPSFNLSFETCSVPIFQWQPKADGKGLKKVNGSRVCGYTADVAAVYAKAQEVCDRLNAERAEVAARPDWLRKQFSLPRPESVPPRAPHTERIPPAAVRAIRNRVAKRTLIRQGFAGGANATWTRVRGEQIQLIYFQASSYGHEYFVNLALHFTFLPPLFKPAESSLPIAEYELLDCGLRARLTGEFAYGSDAAALENQFAANIVNALEMFVDAEQQFAQPFEALLDAENQPLPQGEFWWALNKRFYQDLANARPPR